MRFGKNICVELVRASEYTKECVLILASLFKVLNTFSEERIRKVSLFRILYLMAFSVWFLSSEEKFNEY